MSLPTSNRIKGLSDSGYPLLSYLKPDASEYLETDKLRALISRHAEYGASPIYLWTETTVEEAIEGAPLEMDEELPFGGAFEATVPMHNVTRGDWARVNDRAPLWMREPKDVTDEEYENFFKATFNDETAPTAWTHFKVRPNLFTSPCGSLTSECTQGDAGSTSFRSLIYLPSAMPNDFYSKDYVTLESLKLFVRRVFITSDLGENFLPKYLNWVKVFVDADDLPLNVGRDSLQKSRALSQIKRNLVKRVRLFPPSYSHPILMMGLQTLDLFASLAKTDLEKYNELYTKAGVSLKLGAVEDEKNRARIVKLLRFETSSSSNLTSLDDVVSRRKKGQEQIFFMAGTGQKKESLEKSPFVERLIARGYEVLYLGEPMDEMLTASIGSYEGMKFQGTYQFSSSSKLSRGD